MLESRLRIRATTGSGSLSRCSSSLIASRLALRRRLEGPHAMDGREVVYHLSAPVHVNQGRCCRSVRWVGSGHCLCHALTWAPWRLGSALLCLLCPVAASRVRFRCIGAEAGAEGMSVGFEAYLLLLASCVVGMTPCRNLRRSRSRILRDILAISVYGYIQGDIKLYKLQ